MKKILILLLLFSGKCFSQVDNNFMQKNSFYDSVYFKAIQYNSGAGIVHLGIDTVAASPTFGKLVRKTAGGGVTNIYNTDGTLTSFRTLTGGDSSLTLNFDGRDSSGLIVTSNSTIAVSNRQRLVEVLQSGANSNSSQTTSAVYGQNIKTGTTASNVGVFGVAYGGTHNYAIRGESLTTGGTNNIAGYFSAANATNNYGLLVNGGNVGIGTLTPSMKMQINVGRFGLYYNNTGVTAANDLTLIEGNSFPVSGNTQINAITTANWQQGSVIMLFFSGTPVVKNNTAGGAGTATLLLAGGADFNATANDVLTLLYNGVNWIEVSRSVN